MEFRAVANKQPSSREQSDSVKNRGAEAQQETLGTNAMEEHSVLCAAAIRVQFMKTDMLQQQQWRRF